MMSSKEIIGRYYGLIIGQISQTKWGVVKTTNALYNASHTMDNCTTPFVLDTHKICTRSEDIKVSYLVGLRRMENQGGDCAIPCRSRRCPLKARSECQGGCGPRPPRQRRG